MDVSNNFKQKLDFESSVYQKLSQQLKNYSLNTLKKDQLISHEEVMKEARKKYPDLKFK